MNIIGTAGDDDLSGTNGKDVLNGLEGNDILRGGLGDDVYILRDLDTIIEKVGEGIDTVRADFSYTLIPNVENLVLVGTQDIDGTGNAVDNVITGNVGNNVLRGAGGNDTLIGGLGDDTYVLHDLDTIVENDGEGEDTVISSVSYTLGAGLENLNLTSAANIDATGNDADNILTGSVGDNILSGGAGDDVLFGMTGADTLIGGQGNDYYYISDADTIVEAAGEGWDTVYSTISYKLANNVEELVLSGVKLINGTGNYLDNYLVGNDADNTLSGRNGDDYLDGGAGRDTLIGGYDDDIYIINDNDVIVEFADAGTDEVRSSMSYTLGDNLENLTLTGSANIDGTGNDLSNTITGNDGNNTLTGGGGFDTLSGGQGDDTYVMTGLDFDAIVEAAGEGTDTMITGISCTGLADNVENLILTGTLSTNGVGNDLDNVITGNEANNVLMGLGGADTLIGGLGNDHYVVDAQDSVVENAGGGIDTVSAAMTYTLGAFLENLNLTGSGNFRGTGNGLDNSLDGNGGNNTLTGLGGDDVLAGWMGDDTLIGGTGDDLYILMDGDTIVEDAGEGTDTVESSVSYTLGDNLENLTLTNDDHINGTGNAGDNILIGNSGMNTLTGLGGNDILDGGRMEDTLIGGLGDDTYVLNDLDAIVESAGEGTDMVLASIDYTLGDNLENLTLTGSGNINATGNAGINVLTGNDGNNVLAGGLGADTLAGGLGNDTYVLLGADSIVEDAGGGIDTVQTALSYVLGDNLENLVLTGTARVNGTGNADDNSLVGNAGKNKLIGGLGDDTLAGGLNEDELSGGAGQDNFRFDTALSNANKDKITDFVAADDTIQLASAIFTKLTATGELDANFFAASRSGNAVDGDDYILYETDTGKVFYDADGNGKGAKMLITVLAHHPAGLTAADFDVM